MSCCLHCTQQHLFNVLGMRHDFCCIQIYGSSMPVNHQTRMPLSVLAFYSVLRSDQPSVDMYTDYVCELLLSHQ